MFNLAYFLSVADYSYDESTIEAFSSVFSIGFYVLLMILCIIKIVAMWKIFEKAGLPGWYAIIPYFNKYMLFKITWGNGWLFLLCFVCGIGYLLIPFKLAPAFGKGIGFAIGLLFLDLIFLVILGFDKSEYLGPQ